MGSNRTTGRRQYHEDHQDHQDHKDRFGIFVILVALVAFVGEPWAVQATQGWPQFRANARLTGIAASEVPAALSLKWTYQAGETIESSAAIADGIVYVGAGSGDLLAIDLASGKLRWKYATGNLLGESS